MSDWFVAHKDGLRQVHERLVDRRGFGLIGGELYQNVADTDATLCKIDIKKVPNKPRIIITVEDDGHGFHDLTHAWTMYAPSEKKGDPTKAGRFNVGEKVVLSFANEAEIYTTSGTVIFNDTGRHEKPRRKRERGTVFTAELACNQERYDQLMVYMRTIIVRPGLKLIVNGDEVPVRHPIHTFECSLQTEIGDDLRKTIRSTEVQVYETSGDEVAMLYELGIPVVETGDRWHYSVQQKVPLNIDRDNVTPAFLRSVRVAVFNEMHNRIAEDDTTAMWVEEASSDSKCTDDAAETLRVKKYGEKSVAFDPTNPEANNEAAAHGFTVIPSRGLTSGQRDNLKRAGTLQSSSAAFPTAGRGAYGEGGGDQVKIIGEDKWTPGMRLIHEYTKECAKRLMKRPLQVQFVHVDKFAYKRWAACYGRGHLGGNPTFQYNVFVLGYKWFDKGVTEAVDALMIHEFGHEYESNHLSEEYYDALCMLGAKLKRAVMDDPEWFDSQRLTPA
jgi:hypothetical protein